MKKLSLIICAFLLLGSCISEEEVPITIAATRGATTPPIITETAFPHQDKELITLSNGVVVEKLDSFYILQSDIILTQEQIDKINNQKLRSAYITSAINYWPNRIVYYTFASGFSYQSMVRDAIAHWKQNTSLKFIEGTGNGNYIEFFHGDGNYSNIGETGGKQLLSLALGGANTGSAIHEIGHAMGLFHEHCRTDRDNYITILWDNIIPKKQHNFKTFSEMNYEGINLGAFDFNSIMLYPSYISDPSFVYDINKPTMRKNNGDTFSAQRSYLSQGDLEAIKAIYGPPYQRLVHVSTLIDDYVSDTYEKWEYSHSNKIYFYSDEACTIKTKLIYPRKIFVHYWAEKNNIKTLDKKFEIMVPAGSESYDLGNTTQKGEMSFGNSTTYNDYYYINEL